MPLVAAAPAFVLAALVALLIILAYKPLSTVIVSLLSVNIPVVGGALGDLVARGLDGVYTASLLFLDNYVQPIINVVLGPVAAVENAFEVVRGALDVYAAAIATFAEVDIPAALQAGLGITDQQLNIVELYVEGLITPEFQSFTTATDGVIQSYFRTAESDIAALAQRVAALPSVVAAAGLSATDVENLASTVARGAIAAAETTIGAQIQLAYTDATGYARSLITGVEADISRGVADAEQFATTAVNQAIGVITTDIDNDILGALAGIWTDVGAAIPELEGVIGTGDADILDALKRIDWTIPGSIAGVASLAGVTALTLTRFLRDCGIPNCQNLSQFGKDLSGLTALVGGADLTALLVELIHDPSNAYSTVESGFGAIITGAVSTARELLSV